MGERKSCARCKAVFDCQADNIASCHCQKLALTEQQRGQVALQYQDCLCNDCLALVANAKIKNTV